MDKGRKFEAVTDNINKQLHKAIGNFVNNAALTDISHWLHKIEDENELRVRAMVVCQYLIDINELRIEADEREVDILFVNDFISLDHFIHKM